MKYGLIVYKEPHGGRVNRKTIAKFNVGDNIQMYAMERIYLEELKIPKSDIIRIDFHELTTYDGEYVILPINLFFFGCGFLHNNWFPASPKIIPVFIGVHFSSDYFSKEQIAYLKQFSPIGCRDAYTLGLMRNNNIPAYLFGCITATLPMRKREPENGSVYFVDIPNDLHSFIPSEVSGNSVAKYHEIDDSFSSETFRKMDSYAYDLLVEYKEKAKLVITSRLHCAIPCVAMGIPTIFAVNKRSSRFAWVEKFLPIYTKDNFESIDWNPPVPHFETFKKQLIDLVKIRLLETYNFWNKFYSISQHYENTLNGSYIDPLDDLKSALKEHVFLKGNEKYILWGLSIFAEQLHSYISLTWPKAKLVAIVDQFVNAKFHGFETTTIDKLVKPIKVPVIVTSSGATKYVHDLVYNNKDFGIVIYTSGKIDNLPN